MVPIRIVPPPHSDPTWPQRPSNMFIWKSNNKVGFNLIWNVLLEDAQWCSCLSTWLQNQITFRCSICFIRQKKTTKCALGWPKLKSKKISKRALWCGFLAFLWKSFWTIKNKNSWNEYVSRKNKEDIRDSDVLLIPSYRVCENSLLSKPAVLSKS